MGTVKIALKLELKAIQTRGVLQGAMIRRISQLEQCGRACTTDFAALFLEASAPKETNLVKYFVATNYF